MLLTVYRQVGSRNNRWKKKKKRIRRHSLCDAGASSTYSGLIDAFCPIDPRCADVSVRGRRDRSLARNRSLYAAKTTKSSGQTKGQKWSAGRHCFVAVDPSRCRPATVSPPVLRVMPGPRSPEPPMSSLHSVQD